MTPNAALDVIAGMRIFVGSRQIAKQPEGMELFDEAVSTLRAYLATPTPAVEVTAGDIIDAFHDELHDVFVDCDGEITESAIRNALERAIGKAGKFPVAEFEIEGGLLTQEQRNTLVRNAIAVYPHSSYSADNCDAGTKVAEGWKLVPVEPTAMMVAKGTDQHVCEQMDSYYKDCELTDTDCIAIYKAMLAAAPEVLKP